MNNDLGGSIVDPDPGSGIGFFPDPGSLIPNPYFEGVVTIFLCGKNTVLLIGSSFFIYTVQN